jgi:hypothetical protein
LLIAGSSFWLGYLFASSWVSPAKTGSSRPYDAGQKGFSLDDHVFPDLMMLRSGPGGCILVLPHNMAQIKNRQTPSQKIRVKINF